MKTHGILNGDSTGFFQWGGEFCGVKITDEGPELERVDFEKSVGHF